VNREGDLLTYTPANERLVTIIDHHTGKRAEFLVKHEALKLPFAAFTELYFRPALFHLFGIGAREAALNGEPKPSESEPEPT
jgi:hypothetical protein